MFKREILGLREAQAAVETILGEASKDPEQPVSVAIVDHQGEIVCAARMDGATPMFNYMALKKARSSATTGKNTRDWLDFLSKRNYTSHDFVPDATRIPGGVAIIKPEERSVIFGGIGVSGRSGNEDEALSMTGLKALQKSVWG
jgi:glc operon protein GlcG